MMKRILWMLGGMVLVCLVAGGTYLVWAKVGGNLESPAAVGEADSRMYNLEQIYKYLTSDYDETWTHGDLKKKTGFTEPDAGPSGATPGTMYTLDDVAGKIVRFPATGQTDSYVDYDDGDEDYQFGATLGYQDHEDGTVTDLNTGLIWKKCSEGLSDSDCTTGTALTYTWEDAITQCEGLTFAGDDEWRLPNIKELQSIVDYGTSDPAIDDDCFPNTESDYYWSSTTIYYADDYAWFVNFTGYPCSAESYDYHKANGCYVRCVRGGH